MSRHRERVPAIGIVAALRSFSPYFLLLVLAVMTRGALAQTAATGQSIWQSTVATTGCTGCHANGLGTDTPLTVPASVGHRSASNSLSKITTTFTNSIACAASGFNPANASCQADPSFGAMSDANFVTLNNSTSQKLSLSLYIGQFKTPVATGATVNTPVDTARTVDVNTLIASDGTGGAPQDSNGIQLTGANPANGTRSLSILRNGTSLNYNVTYTPSSGFVGTNSVRYTVFNSTGNSGEQTITVNVVGITSASSANGQIGNAFNYPITSNFGITGGTYAASGLPTGLSVSQVSGAIVGTPTQTGTFTATVQATSSVAGIGVMSKQVTIVIGGVTSATTATGQVGNSFGYQILTSPAATNGTYTVSGTLPNGVTLNATNGQLSGTPTNFGTFNVTIGATTSAGVVSESLAITIAGVTSASAHAAAVGSAMTNYQITTSPAGTAGTFTAVGTLPSGVTFNSTSGVISGTPTQFGTFPLTVGATTAAGTVTQAMTFTVAGITSANSAVGAVGQAFNFAITSNVAVSSYSAAPLPAGLSVTGGGIITGTPTTNGTFTPTVSIVTAGGTVTQQLTITISAVPGITSASSVTGGVNVPFTFAIQTINSPTSFGATNLPAGLSIDTNTGVISGTPTAAGATVANVTATNNAGTGNQSLTFNIFSTPALSGLATATGAVGQAFSYQIVASQSPTSYGATGLPSGLSINPSTGAISGTPASAGTSTVTLSATNVAGTGSQTLTLTVLGVPGITSSATSSGIVGQAFSYQITASQSPASFGATNLPAGLSVNSATGAITGTPTTNGTFNATVTATNAAGTGSMAVTITISAVPSVNSSASVNGVQGQAFTYQIGAANLPTSFGATGLPTGLSVNTTTGLISGTPTVSGTFNATVTATNVAGTGTLNLTIFILGPPVISSSATASGTVGTPFSYQITASNSPTSYNATSLPAGLAVNTTSGAISGTPTANGTFNVGLTATNAAGSGTLTLVLTIAQAVVPVAAPATMSVNLNTATSLDLTPFVTGFGVTGVRIVTAPATGAATVSGMRVTYTPRNNYFGSDTFTYAAFGAGGQSAPATVSVTIVGRPDPTQDINTTSLLNAQVQTVQRFARTQISNFARRLESLHRAGRSPASQASAGSAVAAPRLAPAQDPFAETDAAQSGQGPANPRVGRQTAQHDASAIAARSNDIPNPFVSPMARGRADNMAFMPPWMPQTDEHKPVPIAQMAAAVNQVGAAVTDVPNGPLQLMPGRFMGDLISLVSQRSVNLAAVSGNGASNYDPASSGRYDFWIEGTLNFGNQGPASNGGTIDFSTSGLTVGIDWRLNDSLVLGIGVGAARDRTDIGNDGSKSVSRGASVAVYGSYQSTQKMFVDALIGVGTTNIDSDRMVTPIGTFARSDRDAKQVFGSLVGGLELRRSNMLISPYGRIDASYTRLKDATESGVGAFALHYFGESSSSVQAGLGVRAESSHTTSFGWLAPRARIEAIHSFEGDRISQIAYADIIGTRYSIVSSPVERNALVFGVGADFISRGGFSLGFDYQLQRSFPEGTAQGVRLRLTQALDGKSARRATYSETESIEDGDQHLSGIRVDGGWTFDDNVTRGRLDAERLRDTNFNLAVNKVFSRLLSDNMRLLVVGSVGGERWHSYNGLDRLFAAARAELQYRESGNFDAPTLAAFARLTGEQFQSQIRRGYRLSAGVSATQALTDRIVVFGALAHNERYAKNDVFDTRDNSLQVNLDYALGSRSTLYAAGEYRRGDVVSSGTASLANIDIAKVFVADDAFPSAQLFAYRTDATTGIVTLGYNLSFGSRDSLDLSWRRARSTPRQRPGFWAAGPWNYEADQFSVVYLVRF